MTNEPTGTDWTTLNVHHRGAAAENRLLATVMSPLLRRLTAEGAVRAVWCTRFDARGPHLFFLVGTGPGGADRVRSALVEAVRTHLAAHPAGDPFSAEEVERRHRECRGMHFCAADRLPGIAPADSWALGEPGPADFPHPLVRGMAPAAEEEYWGASTELFHRAVACAASGASVAGALAWVAAVDRALGARGAAEEAWRHHAGTLVLPLEARMRAEPAAVLAALPAAVSPRNRALFDRAWAGREDELETIAARIVAAAHREDGRTPLARVRAVRTAVHCTLLLLGLPVTSAIPLVLYAWERSLACAGAA